MIWPFNRRRAPRPKPLVLDHVQTVGTLTRGQIIHASILAPRISAEQYAERFPDAVLSVASGSITATQVARPPILATMKPPGSAPVVIDEPAYFEGHYAGDEEGETCARILPGLRDLSNAAPSTCPGVLELRHREEGGCSCHVSPPCSYCMSLVPECPVCGWRAEEPS